MAQEVKVLEGVDSTIRDISHIRSAKIKDMSRKVDMKEQDTNCHQSRVPYERRFQEMKAYGESKDRQIASYERYVQEAEAWAETRDRWAQETKTLAKDAIWVEQAHGEHVRAPECLVQDGEEAEASLIQCHNGKDEKLETLERHIELLSEREQTWAVAVQTGKRSTATVEAPVASQPTTNRYLIKELAARKKQIRNRNRRRRILNNTTVEKATTVAARNKENSEMMKCAEGCGYGGG